MIEITAKQLYDIYKKLPDPYEWEGDVCLILWPKKNPIIEVEFEVDKRTFKYEWKPTTDLIIKA